MFYLKSLKSRLFMYVSMPASARGTFLAAFFTIIQ